MSRQSTASGNLKNAPGKSEPSCHDSTVFPIKEALHTHTKKVHYANFDRDQYQPTRFLVPGYTNEKAYEKRDSLIAHIKEGS